MKMTRTTCAYRTQSLEPGTQNEGHYQIRARLTKIRWYWYYKTIHTSFIQVSLSSSLHVCA